MVTVNTPTDSAWYALLETKRLSTDIVPLNRIIIPNISRPSSSTLEDNKKYLFLLEKLVFLTMKLALILLKLVALLLMKVALFS